MTKQSNTESNNTQIGVRYCDFCNGDVKPEKVKMTYQRQGRSHVFHDVDAEVCQSCGEEYYHAQTLDRLDEQLSPKITKGQDTHCAVNLCS
jgi:YgiT-type zinc finger domain-containing protein